ncbi:MAG: hypothetical protein AAFX03_05445 [Pseudomonadota bacterium]
MSLQRITLQLARNPGYPNGATDIGYRIVAPLDADAKIDVEAWRAEREACRVTRFHPDETERASGVLTHRGAHWRFHYDEDAEGPDEEGHRLGEHVFKEGEYVSVRHHGEEALTYLVTDVTPLSELD